MDCSDRFGAHGVVGFARVDEEQDKPVLKDLVLSCRVVQKKVEHTFLGRYAGREAARGKNVLLTELIRTDRNEPIRQVFEDLRFRTLTEEGAFSLMEWPLDPERELRDLMEVEADLPGREKAADLNDRVQT
jgi:predicted enzyme involved in methoxymalonyl-ACP biosynthesis